MLVSTLRNFLANQLAFYREAPILIDLFTAKTREHFGYFGNYRNSLDDLRHSLRAAFYFHTDNF